MEWIPTVGLIRWIAGLVQSGSDFLQPEHRLVRRFLRVCKAHGIERTQICRVFPHYNFTPSSFSSVKDTKQLITSDFIDEFVNLFNINREWLEAGGTSVSNDIGTYGGTTKDIEDLIQFVKLLESDTNFRFLHLIVPQNINPKKFDIHTNSLPIALAYRASRNRGGIEFDTYYGCEVLSWDYQKTRIHLRVILKMADSKNIQLRGAYAPVARIREFDEGKICFAELRRFLRGPFDPWNNIVSNIDKHEQNLLDEYLSRVAIGTQASGKNYTTSEIPTNQRVKPEDFHNIR